VAAAGLLLMLTACGLPLPSGVHAPGDVADPQQQPGDIQVLPPGPRAGATPEQEVRDFFGAQSNPDRGHAGARAFLSPALQRAWDDTGPVSVFAGDLKVTVVRTGLLQVTASIIGRIGADGSYSPDRVPYSDVVRVAQVGGRWVLTAVPNGLLLSVADRDRSFRARSTYFLAPAVGRPPAPTHLVPDPIFIPVTADPADALVRRLLGGASTSLGSSVSTAFPPHTRLLQAVSTGASGDVTVNLSPEAARVPEVVKERMSAQLVWTLRQIPVFSKLRLRANGRDMTPGRTGGTGGVQDRGDWASYDPDGLPTRTPAYFVAARALHTLDERVPDKPVPPVSRPPVDAAAVSTDGRQLAVVTRTAAADELRTGPIEGPLTLRLRASHLSDLTWGSGEQGLWFLAGGRLMLAPTAGAPGEVTVEALARFGPIHRLRVSRDGVRVGLVMGSGQVRRLVVGRVSVGDGRTQVVALHAVAPDVDAVQDLAWDSATSLVVLGRFSGVVAPIHITVDGSQVAPVVRYGFLEPGTDPIALAAAPDRPLIVAVTTAAGSHLLYLDTGRQFVRDAAGDAPFYPG
jgi:hypothetical protein